MKTFKRYLAILLAVMMVVSMVPSYVFADDDSNSENSSASETLGDESTLSEDKNDDSAISEEAAAYTVKAFTINTSDVEQLKVINSCEVEAGDSFGLYVIFNNNNSSNSDISIEYDYSTDNFELLNTEAIVSKLGDYTSYFSNEDNVNCLYSNFNSIKNYTEFKAFKSGTISVYAKGSEDTARVLLGEMAVTVNESGTEETEITAVVDKENIAIISMDDETLSTTEGKYYLTTGKWYAISFAISFRNLDEECSIDSLAEKISLSADTCISVPEIAEAESQDDSVYITAAFKAKNATESATCIAINFDGKEIYKVDNIVVSESEEEPEIVYLYGAYFTPDGDQNLISLTGNNEMQYGVEYDIGLLIAVPENMQVNENSLSLYDFKGETAIETGFVEEYTGDISGITDVDVTGKDVYSCMFTFMPSSIGTFTVLAENWVDPVNYYICDFVINVPYVEKVEGNILTTDNFNDAVLLSYLNREYVAGLTTEMASAVEKLNLTGLWIDSLEGIQLFTGLKYLYFANNNITSITDDDGNLFLSQSLIEIDCSHNKLTSLDISNFSSLEYLDCQYNNLTELKVSASNSNLVTLICNDNKLASLDVSSLSALETLNCWNNGMTELKLPNGIKTLKCNDNKLTTLDISNLSALECIDCQNNSLSELILPANGSNAALTSLICTNNKLASLDVSGLPLLSSLYCQNNSLTELKLPVSSSLKTLKCSDNKLAALELSSQTSLSVLDCQNNSLCKLDLSNNSSLAANSSNTRIDNQKADIRHLLKDGKIYTADLAQFIGIEEDELKDLQYNDTRITITDDTLDDGYLEVPEYFAEISYYYQTGKGSMEVSLQIRDYPDYEALFPDEILRGLITRIYHKYTLKGLKENVTTLNVNVNTLPNTISEVKDATGIEDAFTGLTELNFWGTQIESIDLSKMVSLNKLVISSNKLNQLDLSNNVNLEYLLCGENNLKELDVSKNKQLTWFSCSENHLAVLDLSELKDNTFNHINVGSFDDDDYQTILLETADSEINLGQIVGDNLDRVTVDTSNCTYINGIVTLNEGEYYFRYTYDTGIEGSGMDVQVSITQETVENILTEDIIKSSNLILALKKALGTDKLSSEDAKACESFELDNCGLSANDLKELNTLIGKYFSGVTSVTIIENSTGITELDLNSLSNVNTISINMPVTSIIFPSRSAKVISLTLAGTLCKKMSFTAKESSVEDLHIINNTILSDLELASGDTGYHINLEVAGNALKSLDLSNINTNTLTLGRQKVSLDIPSEATTIMLWEILGREIDNKLISDTETVVNTVSFSEDENVLSYDSTKRTAVLKDSSVNSIVYRTNAGNKEMEVEISLVRHEEYDNTNILDTEAVKNNPVLSNYIKEYYGEYLSVYDAAQIINLNLKSVTETLSGLEYFSGLKQLQLKLNIPNLNLSVVNSMPFLDTLYVICYSNALKSIVIPDNQSINTFVLSTSLIYDIDSDTVILKDVDLSLANLKGLKTAGIFDAEIKSLDVSDNSSLENLSVAFCNNIQTLDLSSNDKLTGVGISNNDALKEVCISKSNCYSSIMIKNNSSLTSLDLSDISAPALESDCSDNALTSVNLNGSSMNKIVLDGNKLLMIDNSNFTGTVHAENQSVRLSALNNRIDMSRYYTQEQISRIKIENTSIANFDEDDASTIIVDQSEESFSFSFADDDFYLEIDADLDNSTQDEIYLNKTELYTINGCSAEVVASLFSAEYGIDDIVWSSSDTDVATVNPNESNNRRAVIQAKGNGSCTIKATVGQGDSEMSCQMTVYIVAMSGLTISEDQLTYDFAGDLSPHKLSITYGCDSQYADKIYINWYSENSYVAEVENGTVTPKYPGKTNVYTYVNGARYTVPVSVNAYVKSIYFYNDYGYICKGKTGVYSYHIVSSINNYEATNKNVTWTSSDETIATVDEDGTIHAIAAGNCNITVTTEDGGYSDSITICVYEPSNTVITSENFPSTGLYAHLNQIFNQSNGGLTEDQLEDVTEIEFKNSYSNYYSSTRKIDSVSGLERFTNLEKVKIRRNVLQALDIILYADKIDVNNNVIWVDEYDNRVIFTKSADRTKLQSITVADAYTDKVAFYPDTGYFLIADDVTSFVIDYAGKSITINIQNNQKLLSASYMKSSGYDYIGAMVTLETYAICPFDVTYQWQISKDNGKTYNDIAGETGSQLSLTLTSEMNRCLFQCVVTDETNATAVCGPHMIKIAGESTIIFQPRDYYGNEGSEVKMSVAAKGESLTYQWYKKDVEADSFVAMEGENGSSTTFQLTSLNSGSKYYCVVKTNDNIEEKTDEVGAYIGEQTNAGTDTILTSAGERVTIDVGLSEAEAIKWTVSWQRSTDGGSTWSTIENENSYILSGYLIEEGMNGTMVRCALKDNQDNWVCSEPVTIIIRGQFDIIKEPESCQYNYIGNGSLTFEAFAVGEGISYKWNIINLDSDDTSNTSLPDDKKITLSGIDYNDCEIMCTISDSNGNSKSYVVKGNYTDLYRLNSNNTIKVIKSYPHDISCGLMGSKEFTAEAYGIWNATWEVSTDGIKWTTVTDETITVETATDEAGRVITKTVYSLEYNADINEYRYRCVFSDSIGQEITTASATYYADQSGYDIKCIATGDGIESLTADKTAANPGDTVNLEIKLKEHYSISSVKMNGSTVAASDGSYSFIMPEGNAVVEVNCHMTEAYLYVDTQSTGYRMILPEEISSNYWRTLVNCGEEVRFYVSPNNGFILDSIKIYSADANYKYRIPVSYTQTDDYYSFIMPERNVKIVASSVRKDINLSCEQTENGWITVSKCGYYSSGTQYKVKTYPDDGYTVDYYLLNGEKIETGISLTEQIFTVYDESEVSAVFKKADYKLKVEENINNAGTVKIYVNEKEASTANAGDSVRIELSPLSGYKISDTDMTVVTGKSTYISKLSKSEYMFTMPSSDMTFMSYFEEMEAAEITYLSPEVNIPEDLAGVVSYTLEGHELTVSINGTDNDAWAQACSKADAGFITVTASFNVPDGTTQMTGGYRASKYTETDLTEFDNSSPNKVNISDDDVFSFKLKIATYTKSSDGSYSVVPLTDDAISSTKGYYGAFGDSAGKTTGIGYFNYNLNPDVKESFSVKSTVEYSKPASDEISFFEDNLLDLDFNYDHVNGVICLDSSLLMMDGITVASGNNPVWEICEICAPGCSLEESESEWTVLSATSSLNDGSAIISDDGRTVTIAKTVNSPYTLDTVAKSCVYTIIWTNGSTTKAERVELKIIGELCFYKHWDPAATVTVDSKLLEDNGITFSYDDHGIFDVKVKDNVIPSLKALESKAYIDVPEDAVKYRMVSGYGSDLYSSSLAETYHSNIESKPLIPIDDDFKAEMPLFEIEESTLGEVRYAFSNNLYTRFVIYEFYDEDEDLIDSGTYFAGTAGDFILETVTVGQTTITSEVTQPVIVGSTDSLKVMYYPQESKSTEYLLDIEPVEDTDGKAVTVYLPYSLTGKTYEELKGQTITVYHYPDENDTSKVEELEGECTEYGIKVVMTSFSPIVLDWSKLQRHTVAVQSRSEGTTESVATLKGGGNISIQTGTTLTAPDRKGYEFLGWFTGYSASSNGTLVSSAHTFNYKPVEDIVLTAVYKSSEVTYSLDIDASLYSIKGMQGTESTEEGPVTYKALETVTITYTDTGKTFLYWANESGKIVSKSKEYTFLLGSNTKLHAVCAETGDGSACVVFLTSYNQVLSARSYTSEDTIEYPDDPSKLGYTFDKWVFADTEVEATQETVTARISKGEDDTISIVPTFTKNADTYNLTVESRYGNSLLNTETIENIVKGDLQKVTAGEFDGYVFQHWELNGEILNYSLSFNFLSSATTADTVTITAVYGTEEVEETALVRITEVVPGRNGEKYRLSFTEYFNVPEGCTMVSAGFVMTTDSTKATESYMTLGAEGLKTYTMEGTAKFGTYTMHLNTKNSGLVIYMRGYVQYLDKDENVFTIYSDIAGSSYDALAGTDNGD